MRTLAGQSARPGTHQGPRFRQERRGSRYLEPGFSQPARWRSARVSAPRRMPRAFNRRGEPTG